MHKKVKPSLTRLPLPSPSLEIPCRKLYLFSSSLFIRFGTLKNGSDSIFCHFLRDFVHTAHVTIPVISNFYHLRHQAAKNFVFRPWPVHVIEISKCLRLFDGSVLTG
jgi:hypothetical protein